MNNVCGIGRTVQNNWHGILPCVDLHCRHQDRAVVFGSQVSRLFSFSENFRIVYKILYSFYQCETFHVNKGPCVILYGGSPVG